MVLALGLLAGGRAARAEESGACKEDVEKFCKDVKPGEGRIVKCLKEHESELSAGCKQKQAEHKAARKERAEKFKEACQADIQQFCKDVKPGEGRILKCLKEHASEVSAGCRDALPKKK
jgi:hypothetical protein